MHALEANVEKPAVLELKRSGFLVIKLGLAGLPDRMVLGFHGRIWFMEFKTHSGRLRKAQVIWKRLLENRGFEVLVPRCLDDVRSFIEVNRDPEV